MQGNPLPSSWYWFQCSNSIGVGIYATPLAVLTLPFQAVAQVELSLPQKVLVSRQKVQPSVFLIGQDKAATKATVYCTCDVSCW